MSRVANGPKWFQQWAHHGVHCICFDYIFSVRVIFSFFFLLGFCSLSNRRHHFILHRFLLDVRSPRSKAHMKKKYNTLDAKAYPFKFHHYFGNGLCTPFFHNVLNHLFEWMWYFSKHWWLLNHFIPICSCFFAFLFILSQFFHQV